MCKFLYAYCILIELLKTTKQGRSKHPEVLLHKQDILVVKLNLNSPIKMPQSEFKDIS